MLKKSIKSAFIALSLSFALTACGGGGGGGSDGAVETTSFSGSYGRAGEYTYNTASNDVFVSTANHSNFADSAHSISISRNREGNITAAVINHGTAQNYNNVSLSASDNSFILVGKNNSSGNAIPDDWGMIGNPSVTGLSHVNFASYYHPNSADDGNGVFGAFVAGNETATLPTTGTFTFTGKGTGIFTILDIDAGNNAYRVRFDVSIGVNFAASGNNIITSFSTSNVYHQRFIGNSFESSWSDSSGSGAARVATFNMSGTGAPIDNIPILDPDGDGGTASLKFYGNGAEEIGGRIGYEYRSSHKYVASFGAKRSTE